MSLTLIELETQLRELQATVRELKDVAKGDTGRDGKDGRDGRDGKSVSGMRLVAAMKSVFGTQRAPNIIVEPKIEFKVPDINFTAPEVVVNNNYQPPELRAPDVIVNNAMAPVEVTFQAPDVHVVLEATMPPPIVSVNLPARRTETDILRDQFGNIEHATQIETDASVDSTLN